LIKEESFKNRGKNFNKEFIFTSSSVIFRFVRFFSPAYLKTALRKKSKFLFLINKNSLFTVKDLKPKS